MKDAQQVGVEMSDDMINYTGSVLEGMKKVYEATTSTKGMENTLSDISKHIVGFVKKTKGVWDQPDWEAFLKDLQKKGIDLTDKTSSYLGEVIEAAGKIYTTLPTIVSKAEKKETPKK